ncbi:MAG: hypothetical protein WAV46_02100 [Candidatus Moraniibacteriota bacterium]
MKHQQEALQRWQTLDIIKTVGLLGALFFHVFVWWFGKNWGATGAAFYSFIGAPVWLMLTFLVVIHFLLLSAGASLYFYLKKYQPTLKTILLRVVLLLLLGVVFGLNLHPLVVFWNVFMLYAVSVLTIFLLDRYVGKRAIMMLTAASLLLTPFLRFFLGTMAPQHYASYVLVGDPAGIASFYPFFPWFFLMGAGFLTSHFYRQYQKAKLLGYGLFGGAITTLLVVPFLRIPDFTNIFGFTSQMSISYAVLMASTFIFLVSWLELLLHNIKLSPYNPAVALGRHILPVYLTTVFITLIMVPLMKQYVHYRDGTRVFLILEIMTFLIAYLVAALLTCRAVRRRDHRAAPFA